MLSEAAGDERNLARTYLIVDFAELNLGVSAGHAHAAAALEIYSRLGDLSGEANAANNLGVRYYYAGRWDDAADLYRRAKRARDLMGDPVNSAFCAVNLAELLVEQGHLDPAEQALVEALTVLQSADDRWGVAFARQVLGVARVRLGRLDEGAELIRAAQADYVEIGAKSSAIDANTVIAEYLVLDRRPDEAIAVLDELIADHGVNGGHEPQMPIVHRLRGYARAQLDDLSGAQTELLAAVTTARHLEADHEVGLALDALVNVLVRFGTAPDDTVISERDEILSRLGIVRRRDPLATPEHDRV
jgi:tetratricopeptide (TPR) repeat protein